MRKEILTDEKIKLDIPYSRAQDWGDVTDKVLRFFSSFYCSRHYTDPCHNVEVTLLLSETSFTLSC